MTIKARPNMNGNTAAHFVNAYRQFSKANRALMDAIVTVRTDVVHGRNYQSGQGPDAQKQDLELLRRVELAKQQLDVFESFLMIAASEGLSKELPEETD